MKHIWKLTGLLLLALLLLLAGCSGDTGEAEEVVAEADIAVEVHTVELGNISTEHLLSGTVAAGEMESIYVALSARCKEVRVKVGDVVEAGDVICVLDLAAFHDNYSLAQTNYNAAKQSYGDQAQLFQQQLEQAENNYQNTLTLLEIGAASQVEVDAAHLTVENLKVARNSTLSQLEVSMKSSQNSMKQVSDSLKNVESGGTVRTSVSGSIVALNIAKDGYAAQGAPIAVIEPSGERKIKIMVSESIVPKLQVGDSVSVSINAIEENFQSSISSISSTADQMTRLYGVEIDIPAGITGILSGMFAEVTLYTDSRNQVVLVPTEAILVDNEGHYLVTLDASQVAHLIRVQTGLVGDGVTEVTYGLSGGETLVIVGQSYLAEGDAARIVSQEG